MMMNAAHLLKITVLLRIRAPPAARDGEGAGVHVGAQLRRAA